MLRKWSNAGLALVLILLIGACSQIGTGGNAVVPTTGNSINDPASAARFLPNLPGYITTDVGSVSDAITAAGGSAALFTGNPIVAGLIAQIDGMIGCYQGVGALAAKVYVQADVGAVLEGSVPRLGAMAVINQDRVINNLIPCALGQNSMRAQADAVQPCANSGSFVVNGETLYYLYAASNPDLCALFQAAIPAA